MSQTDQYDGLKKFTDGIKKVTGVTDRVLHTCRTSIHLEAPPPLPRFCHPTNTLRRNAPRSINSACWVMLTSLLPNRCTRYF